MKALRCACSDVHVPIVIVLQWVLSTAWKEMLFKLYSWFGWSTHSVKVVFTDLINLTSLQWITTFASMGKCISPLRYTSPCTSTKCVCDPSTFDPEKRFASALGWVKLILFPGWKWDWEEFLKVIFPLYHKENQELFRSSTHAQRINNLLTKGVYSSSRQGKCKRFKF